jgi:LysR family transcriptional regulator, low CO2-responsive transcriptional regulator
MTALDEPIDARRLRAFLLLAREASFASAAAALGQTPSAMSHSIKTLEEELGGALFDRRGHRAVLTAAGERLLPHAERVMRHMRAARQEISAMREWGRGTLRIAAPASACQYFLPSVLLEFRECFPECTISITAMDAEAAIKQVEEGKLDLAISVHTDLPDTQEWHSLFKDTLQFFASPMHPWASAKRLSRKDILGQQVIVYDRNAVTTRLVLGHLKQLGVRATDILSLGSMEAIKEMVKVGLGIGILAPWVTARECETGSLVRAHYPAPLIEREWGVVSYAGHRLNLVAETFLGLCKEATSSLAASSK